MRRRLVTQISNLLVAFALMTLSINLRGAATVALNNYDAHMAIYLADGRMLAPANGSVYVELLGGPSADQLSPVVSTMGVTISTISANDKPGFFDYGVGVVPGVADGATATFQLEVWQGGLNPPPGSHRRDPALDTGHRIMGTTEHGFSAAFGPVAANPRASCFTDP